MKGPLVFEDRADRVACMLGVVEAAEILAIDNRDGQRAAWSFWLRGFERKYVLAGDTDAAKAAVQAHAQAWLRAAGVRPMTAEELEEDRETRPA